MNKNKQDTFLFLFPPPVFRYFFHVYHVHILLQQRKKRWSGQYRLNQVFIISARLKTSPPCANEVCSCPCKCSRDDKHMAGHPIIYHSNKGTESDSLEQWAEGKQMVGVS